MLNKIFPCLWYNGDAGLAAQFYTQIFDGKITENTFTVVSIKLFGQKMMLLNAGPQFEKNASISFMVMCETEEEVDRYWEQLAATGTVLKDLGEYPWSKCYGWVRDSFGVTWQIYLGDKTGEQKIIPTLMFVHQNNGKAMQAMQFYTGVFPESSIGNVLLYGDGVDMENQEPPNNVQHAHFKINGYSLFCMDNSYNHPFNFNEGISFVVMTQDQQETDELWEKLTENGSEAPCGWLKDKFGLSWQIVPGRLIELLNQEDPAKSQKAVSAMLKMKKIEIALMEAAVNS